jgi:orotate phosphoribosyltransferase
VTYSAVQYVQKTLGLGVCAIAQLDDLLSYLTQHQAQEMAHHLQAVQDYRARYGV